MIKTIRNLLFLLILLPLSTQAEILLEVDVSVDGTITITSTNAAASASVSGLDFRGFYLADFFAAGDGSGGSFDSSNSGDLTSAQDMSDGSPRLYRGSGRDTGLNVWSYTDTTDSSFVAGEQAFSGAATWTVDDIMYADAINGASSGLIYFEADTLTIAENATVIGEWSRAGGGSSQVSAPSSLGIIALSILGFCAMRKVRRA